MNFLLIQSLKKPPEKLLSEVLGKNQKIKLNNRLNLFVSENNINDCFFKDKDIAGYVMGYARSYLLNSSDSINHNLFTAKEISNKKWPLSTIDLISIASMNIEQELIGELKDLK